MKKAYKSCYFHYSETTLSLLIFFIVKISFLEICMLFHQHFSAFHNVCNKSLYKNISFQVYVNVMLITYITQCFEIKS